MAKEIEHKYIVVTDEYKNLAKKKTHIFQGYLSKDPERIVRIRITDNSGFITIKGKTNVDTRAEFEYAVPIEDAKQMLKLCAGKAIEKIRWIVEYSGLTWEVDEFVNPPVETIAEVELPYSHHDYLLPPFVGREVTGEKKYYNSNITAG